jgi:hypothetical protein
LRRRIGRGVAWVEQDYLRRTLLREHARAAAPNIGLIEQTARYALEHGYHVILEGGLYGPHYGVMLRQLIADHAGVSGVYYFQLSFDETIRRQVIDESSSLDETADRIITDLTWTTGGTTPHPLEG